jgi:FKBP-type peptidyl-prolyl cis-trans isomerase
MPGLVPVLALALAMALGACGGNPAAQNLAAAKAFLADVARQPGVVRLPSGLEYRVLQSGPADGHRPHADDYVLVNYDARLTTGEVVDSSYARGQPDSFQVGALVPAWTEALQRMRPGDVWMLYSPPSLAYGEQGAGPIPPNSALVFKIELVSVLPRGGAGQGR